MPHPILHHARTTGSALKNWFVAQCYDALAVAALWLVGLLIIRSIAPSRLIVDLDSPIASAGWSAFAPPLNSWGGQ